jgi:hypothetical protein
MGGVIGHFGQLLELLEEVVVDVFRAVTVLEPLGEGRSRVLLVQEGGIRGDADEDDVKEGGEGSGSQDDRPVGTER